MWSGKGAEFLVPQQCCVPSIFLQYKAGCSKDNVHYWTKVGTIEILWCFERSLHLFVENTAKIVKSCCCFIQFKIADFNLNII